MRDRLLLALIVIAVAGCSSQPTEIAANPQDGARSRAVAAQHKARLAGLFEHSYPACARDYPQRRLLDLSIDPRPIPQGEVSNRVRLDRSGPPLWNGQAVKLEQVREFLEITTTMTPRPLLIVEVEKGAPGSAVRDLHEVIIRSGICPDPTKS